MTLIISRYEKSDIYMGLLMKSLFFENIYGFWLNQIEIGNRWVGQRGLKGQKNQYGVPNMDPIDMGQYGI